MIVRAQLSPRMRRRLTIAALAGAMVLVSLASVNAQGFFGIADPWSPFIFPPGLQGEARITPIWVSLSSGSDRIPSRGINWDLRNHFNMTRSNPFIDLMVRIGLGRYSLRGHYETREFVGSTNFGNDPRRYVADSRLDYTGIRIGGDIDAFLCYGARFGANLDLDLYQPIFTEAVQTPDGGKKIMGESAFTWGLHASYSPTVNVWGLSGTFEARVRWPALGASVTDLELAAGIRGPESILGSAALRFGWRKTTIEFDDSQYYINTPVYTQFEAELNGLFMQLVYYY